jgi:hypothetical protein
MQNVTIAQAKGFAAAYEQSGAIASGFNIARGRSEGTTSSAWLEALIPDIPAINQALDYKIPVDHGISLPIGLSIITGKAGSGKTTFLNKVIAPAIPNEMEAYYLKIGEPGFFIPYTVGILVGTIEGCAKKITESGKSGIILIDSLLSLWFDPAVTAGFTTGRGGASLGVPVILQTIGQFALARGLRVVAVLHPVFADPEVIGSGISGVSSLFLNRDTGAFIVRDYEKLPEQAIPGQLTSLTYQRKEANMGGETDESLSLLVSTMGDND